MKSIIAAIYTNYETTVVDCDGFGGNHGGFVGGYPDEKLILKFERIAPEFFKE